MRIEGTYTFPGPIERVFSALLDPEALKRGLPGCERIVQFGPPAADGAASFEARVRPDRDAGVYTLRISGVVARRPAHLRVELRGRGPQGPVTGAGRIDLVAQDEFTIGAYVFDVETEAREAQAAGQRFARLTCEQLAETIRPTQDSERAAETPLASPERRVVARGIRTPRGRIVALPATPSLSPLSANADAWMERLGWMAAGMALGMAALGLLAAASRWMGGHDQ